MPELTPAEQERLAQLIKEDHHKHLIVELNKLRDKMHQTALTPAETNIRIIRAEHIMSSILITLSVWIDDPELRALFDDIEIYHAACTTYGDEKAQEYIEKAIKQREEEAKEG